MKKLTRTLAVVALAASAAGISLVGCGSSSRTTGTGTSQVCQPGTFRQCPCSVITSGTETCAVDGSSWGSCVCAADAGTDGPIEGGTCGDGTCSTTESCVTCPADCGICPACTEAPTCTGASSVPSSPTPLASFNNAGQTMYSSGVNFNDGGTNATCSDPLLKMRVSQIVVHKNARSGSDLEMFCLVQADDGQSSQLMLTPSYTGLASGAPPIQLAPAAGTFWGEAVNGVKLSQFNVTVTYQCYLVLQPTALTNALNAIAGVAGAASGLPGNPYGWAFGLGGAAAAAAAAATAVGSGAVPLLSVTQTIDSSSLLKLTNGYTWVIEQSGSTEAQDKCGGVLGIGAGPCDWDWELDIEAWGCAAPAGEMPM
jgi:hypothetical protein